MNRNLTVLIICLLCALSSGVSEGAECFFFGQDYVCIPLDFVTTDIINWDTVISQEIQTEGMNWESLNDDIGNAAINWDDMSPISGQVMCWNGNALGTCDNVVSVSGTCNCI
jgi:hypothetical protein